MGLRCGIRRLGLSSFHSPATLRSWTAMRMSGSPVFIDFCRREHLLPGSDRDSCHYLGGSGGSTGSCRWRMRR